MPNNVQTVYTYDEMSRLTRLKDSNSTATLFDRQYSYNSANQISQITEPNLTRTFNYDNVNRLTGVTASNSANESYTYDSVGNRTNSHLFDTYNYQANNRVTSASSSTNGTINYDYDSNGAMTTKAEGSNLWKYVWDHEKIV